MSYSVYILYSKIAAKNSIQVTCQDNFTNRLLEHNSGETKSIKMCIPWQLIWDFVNLATRSEAMMLEKKIKSRGAARFLEDLGIEVT